MARKIVITSGKGGVGKTTVCANLGVNLAKMGLRVMILDVDIGLNNLDVVAGIETKIVYDIVDIIEGKCRPRQALIQHTNLPSLYILPSVHSYNVGKVDGESLKAVVNHFSSSFDYILIDCPAGIELGFHRAVFCADEALIVTTPHISALRDANKVISILNSYYLSSIKLVINRVRGDLVASKNMLEQKEIAQSLDLPLVGVIPESDDLQTLSSIYGNSVSKDFESSKAFAILADNLHNGYFNEYNCISKYKGFVGKIKRGLKRRI